MIHRRSSLIYLVLSGWIWSMMVAASEATSGSIAAISSSSSSFNDHDHQDDSHRNLAMYALYSIPTFAVTFTTKHTEELQIALDEESSALLSETGQQDSSLSFPIRSTTESFLLERFKSEITTMFATKKEKDDISPIYEELIAVDLRTKLYVSNEIADHQQKKNRKDHEVLLHTNDEKVTLIAEMYGTLAFLEPADKSIKPSNEEVWELFGGWMEDVFTNHRDQYLRELVQSEQELLREISALDVETSVDDDPNYKSPYAEGWSSRTEKALLTMLVLFCLMGMVWMFLYLKQRHRHRLLKTYDDSIIDDDFSGASPYPHHGSNGGNNSFASSSPGYSVGGGGGGGGRATSPYSFNSSSSIPRPGTLTMQDRMSSLDHARHGPDTYRRSSQAGAMAVLEDADRYLSKHRPDLYRQGSEPSYAEISVFGRNYSIPANPFEYIYSSFADQGKSVDQLHSPGRGAFSPPNERRNSLQIQKENIAMVPENLEELYDEEYDPSQAAFRQQGYGGGGAIGSIWRNLNGMWEDVRNPRQPQPTTADGLPFFSSQQHEQQLQEHQEDPTDYNFAFQDFPRHDGTPCLIYNSDEQQQIEEQKRVFEIGDMEDDDMEEVGLDDYAEKIEATTPVSDRAFQRMLSQHSLNISTEDIVFEDNDAKDDDNDDLASAAKSTEFKEKLDRLVQQKKRQYEKKSIIEKHREQKAKERKQIREMERRERHKAMEAEIESIEASFKSPLERSRAMQMSPKVPRSYSPTRSSGSSSNSAAADAVLRSGYSPKPSVCYSPKRSPMRAKHETYRAAFSPAHNNNNNDDSDSWPKGDDASSISSRSSSGRPPSVLPPGGMEDTSSFSLRPRTARPPPGSGVNTDLNINTGYGNQSSSSLDSKTMDKLSMPSMTIDGGSDYMVPIGGGAENTKGNTKHPSPQSVLDEMIFSTPKKRNINRHKRSSSYSWEDDKTRWDEEQQIRQINSFGYHTDEEETISSKGSGSDKGMSNKQKLPPRASSRGRHHMRSNSQSSYSANQSAGQSTGGSSKGGHNRRATGGSSHRRSNSTQRHRRTNTGDSTEDVFLHGVFAQTRQFA